MFMDSTASVMMERAISATWQRAQLINHNIANQDTPNFKARRLEFESHLRAAMERNERSITMNRQERFDRIRSAPSRVLADERTEIRADGNNVDVHSEQIELARVQLHHQALRDNLNNHFNRMRTAISGGR